MQYWDEVLYPSFRSIIRGEYYGIVSEDFIDEECFNLAQRAISTFKFPKVSLDYKIFYAIRNHTGELEEVELEDYPDAVPHAFFYEDLGFDEIQVLIA